MLVNLSIILFPRCLVFAHISVSMLFLLATKAA